MSAIAQTTKAHLRIIGTSVRALEWGVAAAGAIALALAFPKIGQAWLAPLGAAALFWTWRRLSWKRALYNGWFAGLVFFAISFWWFSDTIVHDIGGLAYLAVLIIAAIEAIAFALAAAATSFATAFAPPPTAPLASAAAFTFCEWARSTGTFGVPFAQIGYSQADSPLAVFAAYAGTFGVTFAVVLIGAYVAQAIALRRNREMLAALAALLVIWMGAYGAWPARHTSVPRMRVAAVQGNIAQTLKWSEPAFRTAVDRYTAMTLQARGFAPDLVVWPETVITTTLNRDAPLQARFSALARTLHTTLAIGSQDFHGGGVYNAMYVFSPDGRLRATYDKRELVPFAESFPGKAWLKFLPGTSIISDFSAGTIDGVYATAGLSFAPLICWESAFAELAHAQLRNGAQLLVIATDDAWFGETSGPFQHAQIAQLRAIEAGSWVVRAGATGVSGIIAPDGRWTQATALDRQAIVEGYVGRPPGSPFARIGPAPIAAIAVVLWGALVAFAPLRSRRQRA